MRSFTTYIEYLLMTRHYCFVPGHGAYMMVDESALLDTTPSIGNLSRLQYSLRAPHRIVRFSPLHSHDDGMLANLLMEAEGMTYDEASRYIERQAPLLSEDFTEKASIDTDTEHFGFEALSIETWADIEARILAANQPVITPESATPHHDTIAIPKYWIKRAAIVLLVALFFFTDFIGLNQGNTQLASIINVNKLQQRIQPSSSIEDNNSEQIEVSMAPNLEESSSTYAPIAIQHSDNIKMQDVASLHSNSTEYYIVVECTKSIELAEKACLRYQRYGYQQTSVMVTPTGTCRLYIEHFADLREAANRLRELRRTDERLKSAWLLPLEGTSLSSNIKNKYNDNQLSLELSHPNQRTERDQG